MEGYLEKLRNSMPSSSKAQAALSPSISRASPTGPTIYDNENSWKRKWAVLNNAKLYYYDQPPRQYALDAPYCCTPPLTRLICRGDGNYQSEAEKGCIPLVCVNYIRTAPEHGANAFEIGTFSRKFVFRAQNEESAKQWLLGMHCSIAQVWLSVYKRAFICRPFALTP